MLSCVDFIPLEKTNAVMPEETGATIEENARIKSESVYAQTGLPTLAEDSGLCVDALDGEPGVHSARYAGGTEQNIARVLERMASRDDRDAHFETIFSFTDHQGTRVFTGRQDGRIGFGAKGVNGFGYDPIFINELGKTNAESDINEKNSISARGKAMRAFVAWFRENR
jgi:XTP/dITP diphosphohydrolase